jgi:hypothetical protein
MYANAAALSIGPEKSGSVHATMSRAERLIGSWLGDVIFLRNKNRKDGG